MRFLFWCIVSDNFDLVDCLCSMIMMILHLHHSAWVWVEQFVSSCNQANIILVEEKSTEIAFATLMIMIPSDSFSETQFLSFFFFFFLRDSFFLIDRNDDDFHVWWFDIGLNLVSWTCVELDLCWSLNFIWCPVIIMI